MRKKLFSLFLPVLCWLLIMEGLICCCIAYPSILPSFVLSVVQEYYMAYDRSIIQYEPKMAKFDRELLYTLKPGNFSFSNREFNTEYSVNSEGLRDTEENLRNPEVLFLGDSFTMGWGVEQDETFSALFAQQTGLRTLNAGISSYGTVREMAILNRIPSAQLKLIVLQYCNNDYSENAHAILTPSPKESIATKEAQYYATQSTYLQKKGYYPLKYTIGFFTIVSQRILRKSGIKTETFPVKTAPELSEKQAFLQVLKRWKNPKNIPILLLALNGKNGTDAFVQKITSSDSTARVQAIKVYEKLNQEDFFLLDDHLNQQGHYKIAQLLVKATQSLP